MNVSSIARRLVALARRTRLDDELTEEMRLHMELRRQSLVDDGMDPREAAYEARRMFGNITCIREETRAMWGFRWADMLVQDLRYGGRLLRRSPLFTTVAVLSLAIGIGAAAAVFSVADAVLFRKLPVGAPDELVSFRWISGPAYPFESLNGYGRQDDDENSSTSFARTAYETIRSKVAADADVFGFADLYRVNVSVDGQPDTAYAQAVSGNYFAALRVSPAAGRLIAAADDRPDAPAVAVISHDFWQRRFGAVPDALGSPLVLNGVTFTIVGVTPPRFTATLQVGQRTDVTVPLSAYKAVTRGEDPDDPTFWWVLMMARLKPGARTDRVQSAADVILKQTVAAAKPAVTPRDLPRVAVESGARGQVEDRDAMREPINAMALVVGIVLLVACANVANLLLARGSARLRELTVRVAIGAPRSRVIRQLVTEGLLLSVLASALGLTLAQLLATALLPALASPQSLFEIDTGLDWRVAVFTALLATVCSLVFGLAPAFRATDVKLASGLQENARSAAGGRQRNLLAGGLVVVQVALSMLLLTAAGLLTFSVRNLQDVDPGFNPHNVLLFRIDPTLNGYDESRVRELCRAALERLAALPGVTAVTLSSHPLIANSSSIGLARREGEAAPAPGSVEANRYIDGHRAWRNIVGDRFFETMEIPLVRGRTFVSSDTQTSQKVAVVNRLLARQLFGTDDVVGRRFVLGLRPGQPAIEIVGVSADARYTSIRGETQPTVYLHYSQFPARAPTLEIRSATRAEDLAPAVRDAMRQIDPTVPLYAMRTQDEQIALSLQREILFARLAGMLGLVALLLSAIGLYGLMAYSVARRTPEIGVRMALGADRGAVRWMVLRQSLQLVAIGLVLGVPAAIAGTRLVQSMLYGLEPTDPATIAAAACVMTLVSVLAAFLPARRASRVDPIVALRLE